MSAISREATVLSTVRDSLIAEGFEVIIEPNHLSLPPFLEGLRPDALAFRKDKNLVVEVATQTPAAEKRIRALQERVANQPDWEFRLIWLSSGSRLRPLHRTPIPVIENTLSDVETLIDGGYVKAALLLAWSTLEAIGRTLQPDNLGRPQTPTRLVEQLAVGGAVLPNEADELRDLISKRNRLVHGELRVDVQKRNVALLVKIARRLTAELASAA